MYWYISHYISKLHAEVRSTHRSKKLTKTWEISHGAKHVVHFKSAPNIDAIAALVLLSVLFLHPLQRLTSSLPLQLNLLPPLRVARLPDSLAAVVRVPKRDCLIRHGRQQQYACNDSRKYIWRTYVYINIYIGNGGLVYIYSWRRFDK